jgi:hypothetical protein
VSYARASLGDTWDTVKSMSASVDPYLPEVFCRIDQLKALHQNRTPLEALFGKAPTVAVPKCINVPPGQNGIGVEKALKPLRAASYLYQNPSVVWAGLTAVMVVPFLAGYVVGRRSRAT